MKSESILRERRSDGSLAPSRPVQTPPQSLQRTVPPGSQFATQTTTLPNQRVGQASPVSENLSPQTSASADRASMPSVPNSQPNKPQAQAMNAPAANQLPTPAMPAKTSQPNQPFHPIPDPQQANADIPQAQTQAPVKAEAKPQAQTQPKPKTKAKAKKKGGLFSFWTNRSTRKKEMVAMRESNEKMANMMRDMCEIIEQSGARQAKVIEERVLEPFPLLAINAINKSQEKVQGTLTSLDNHLAKANTHMAKANARETQVLQTLNGVETAGTQSATALGDMQSQVSKSTETFETLYAKMERAEQKFSRSMTRLQKRALWTNVILGLALLGTLGYVAYLLYNLQQGNGVLQLTF